MKSKSPVDSKLRIEPHEKVDFRLKEWARSINMVVSFGKGESVLYRLQHEQDAAFIRGVGGGNQSDGGMVAALQKYEFELKQHVDARETNHFVMQMPYDYIAAVTVTYCTKPGLTIGRPTAADKLGVTQHKYVELFNRAMGWLEGRLGL